MNGVTKTFLSIFISWIKIFLNSLLNFLNDPNSFNLLKFIAQNWIVLSALLLLIGIVLDWIFWMIRWKPYYVWLGKKKNNDK